jgi:aryl-alcohol dehydrogenase-like predicted oxidoreductase
MQYNSLPKVKLNVSQISLGTMMFGGQTGEADSLKIMDYAYDHGINFFDTANSYNQGESERVVGKGLKGRRDAIILATKVFNQVGPTQNDGGLSRRHIRAEVENSLRRLDTDYIDIYYLHAPDHVTDFEETLEAMTSLVQVGKIRYIGISNFAAWQMADILAVCDKRDYIAPVITQNVYNPITRGIEGELLPFLRAHPLGLAVYNPIAAGLLAGKHKPGQRPAADTRFATNQMYYDRYWSEENFAAVEKLMQIAAEHGLSILRLAMKWCARNPQVTTIISGVSRLEQLEQNIASVEGEPLNAAVLAQCDEVWQTLAGTRFKYYR